jgi:hypothetical protein
VFLVIDCSIHFSCRTRMKTCLVDEFLSVGVRTDECVSTCLFVLINLCLSYCTIDSTIDKKQRENIAYRKEKREKVLGLEHVKTEIKAFLSLSRVLRLVFFIFIISLCPFKIPLKI